MWWLWAWWVGVRGFDEVVVVSPSAAELRKCRLQQNSEPEWPEEDLTNPHAHKPSKGCFLTSRDENVDQSALIIQIWGPQITQLYNYHFTSSQDLYPRPTAPPAADATSLQLKKQFQVHLRGGVQVWNRELCIYLVLLKLKDELQLGCTFIRPTTNEPLQPLFNQVIKNTLFLGSDLLRKLK